MSRHLLHGMNGWMWQIFWQARGHGASVPHPAAHPLDNETDNQQYKNNERARKIALGLLIEVSRGSEVHARGAHLTRECRVYVLCLSSVRSATIHPHASHRVLFARPPLNVPDTKHSWS